MKIKMENIILGIVPQYVTVAHQIVGDFFNTLRGSVHLCGSLHDGTYTQVIVLDHELQIFAQIAFHQTLTIVQLPVFDPVLHGECFKVREAVKTVLRNHELGTQCLVIIIAVLGSCMQKSGFLLQAGV